MSKLFDDSSLAMIPSAVKDGKLYSIRPTDGSGDFTFSRGSNLAATRVDVNGLIEKGRENLLLQSNQFDTTWVKSSSVLTLTDNQSGYDGLSNAWKLESTSSISSLSLSQTVASSGVQVFSVYAKAGSVDWVRINLSGVGNRFFNISNGTIGSEGSLEGTITSAGNGWYRISILGNGSSSAPLIFPSSNDDDTTLSNGDNIYIQDAQLELGLVATDYIETGASTAQAGILEDMPRLDYSGSCPSLLLEPQRANFIPHSEYISSSAGWTITDFGTGAGAPVVTLNAAMSPEGKMNACQIDFQSCTGAQQSAIAYSVSGFSVGDMITHSVYLKAPVDCTLIIRDSSIFNEDPINVTTEWQRFDITAAAGYTYSQFKIGLRPSQGSQSDACSVYMYAPQIEAGSYPTSYIPTYGTSQTRSDESSTTASSDLISTQAFTIFFEHKALGMSGTSWTYALEMADGSDEIEFYVNGGSGMNIYLGGNGGYVFGTSSNDGYRAGLASKVALSYDGDKLSYFINGSLYDSATGVSFNDVNTYLNLRGSRNIALKQSLVFPTALTDSECIALTSI